MLGAINLTKSGTLYVVVILILIITGAMMMTGGVFPVENQPPPTAQLIPVDPKNIVIINPGGRKNLQLYTFYPHPPTTVPANNGCASGIYGSTNGVVDYDKCIDILKPVIYLYPTKPTAVSVKVNVPGRITTSIPLYPAEGWYVTAEPNGTLEYQGDIFHELFYESSVVPPHSPDTGTIIPVKQLREKLSNYTYKLGLLPKEQKEFLDFWVPRLTALHYPFVEFSVYPPNEKQSVDQVLVSPRPETTIAFIAFFKPLQTNVASLKPLLLPQTPPKRIGFTEVEWGGTIGK